MKPFLLRISTSLLVLTLSFFSANSQKLFGDFDTICARQDIPDSSRSAEIFSEQLDLIHKGFSRKKGIPLKALLDFEKANGTEENSLGYWYTLGDGIYPAIRKFKHARPVSFRRLECPQLNGRVDYFYSKRTKRVRVIFFDWIEFKHLGNDSVFFELAPVDSNALLATRQAFQRKFDYLVENISRHLGEPTVIPETDLKVGGVKWSGANGVSASIFLFHRNDYNEIMLVFYRR